LRPSRDPRTISVENGTSVLPEERKAQMLTFDCIDCLWLLVWLAGVVGLFGGSLDWARDFSPFG